MFTLKELFLTKIEEVAMSLKYDFLYEDVDGEFICQIVKRDLNGEILGTPLTVQFEIDEDEGKGEVIFFNSLGEFKRQEFDIINPDTIANVVIFIQERLHSNLLKNKKTHP